MPKITVFGGSEPPVTDEEKEALAKTQEPAGDGDSSILDTPAAESFTKPAVNDPKAAWVDWAVRCGWSPEAAETATKQQLVTAFKGF